MTLDVYPTATAATESQVHDRTEGTDRGAEPAPVGSGTGEGKALTERQKRVTEPNVHYLGFRCTGEGREYRLRVAGLPDPRELVVVISHAAFAARLVSYQDAPSLCFSKVKRALAAEPGLLPGVPLVLSTEELTDHRLSGGKASPTKPRRPPSVAG